jgi:hypothetical protein
MEAARMADSAVMADVSSVLERRLTDARGGLVRPPCRSPTPYAVLLRDEHG